MNEGTYFEKAIVDDMEAEISRLRSLLEKCRDAGQQLRHDLNRQYPRVLADYPKEQTPQQRAVMYWDMIAAELDKELNP